MVRVRNAPSTQSDATTASHGRRVLKEKTNTTRAKAPIYEDDGNTEDLVKDAMPKRSRQKALRQNSDDLMMAGGLAQTDETHPSSEAPMTTDGLRIQPVTARPNRRPARTVRKVVQNETQSKVLQGLKQRMEATARGQRAKPTTHPVASDAAGLSSETVPVKHAGTSKATAERSSLSLSPSPPPPGRLSTIRGPRSSIARPPSVSKAQSTPAIESSILALKNFKRRPRQPSMLQMVQQRRASARPSIAHTTVDNTALENPSIYDLDLDLDLDDEDEDGEDFAPEAEGTPLNLAKTKRMSITSTTQAIPTTMTTTTGVTKARLISKAKKRQSDEISYSSAELNHPQAKRPKPIATHEQEMHEVSSTDKVDLIQSSSRSAETPQHETTSDVHVINSPSQSTPPTEAPSPIAQEQQKADEVLVPSTERESYEESLLGLGEQHDEHDEPNDTMAEPLSSSPVGRNAVSTQDIDVFVDPSTQESPPPVKPNTRKRSKPMTTFELQSLLPKRRQPLRPRQRKSEYDIGSDSDGNDSVDVSHLEDDEDELGGSGRQRQRKSAPSKPAKRITTKSGRSSKTAASTTIRKSTAAPKGRKSGTVPAPRKGPKTYGRSTVSDKENEAYESASEGEGEDSFLPEVSMFMEEAIQTKEVEEAKRKFAAVDDWDMEFESMSAEDHRRSSQEWR